jgi:hypothetical protein
MDNTFMYVSLAAGLVLLGEERLYRSGKKWLSIIYIY